MNVPPVSQFEALFQKSANWCWARLPDPKPLEFEDLMAEGHLAYAKAANRFDPAKGNKFITLLYTCVRNQMRSVLHQQIRQVRDIWTHDMTEQDYEESADLRPELGMADRVTPGRLPRLAWLVLRDLTGRDSPTCLTRGGPPRDWRRRIREKYDLRAPELAGVLFIIGNMISDRAVGV